MAKKRIVTIVCDRCGGEESDQLVVENRVVKVGRKARSVDVCDSCWGPAVEALAELAAAGRPVKAGQVAALSAG